MKLVKKLGISLAALSAALCAVGFAACDSKSGDSGEPNGQEQEHVHSWGESVSYVWNEDNSKCTASRVCSEDSSHVESETVDSVKTVTREASCEEDELSSFSATFVNSAFEKQTKADVKTGDALGHDWENATYQLVKQDNEWVCYAKKVCKHGHFEEEYGEMESVEESAANCSSPATVSYTAKFKKTNYFSAIYSNIAEFGEIDETAHDWKVKYNWTKDDDGVYTACVASAVCRHNEAHTKEKVNGEIGSVESAATCTEPAKIVYTATFAEDSGYEADSKTVITKEALGHGWNLTSVDDDLKHAVRTCGRSGCGVEETVDIDAELSEKVGNSENTLESAQLIEPGKTYYMHSANTVSRTNNFVQFKIPAQGGKVVLEIAKTSASNYTISPVYYWAKGASSCVMMVNNASQPIRVAADFTKVFAFQYGGKSRYVYIYRMEFDFDASYGEGTITFGMFSNVVSHLITLGAFEAEVPEKEYTALNYNPEQANTVVVNENEEAENLSIYQFVAPKAGTYSMRIGGGISAVYNVGTGEVLDIDVPFIDSESGSSRNFEANKGQKFVWAFVGAGGEDCTVLIGDKLPEILTPDMNPMLEVTIANGVDINIQIGEIEEGEYIFEFEEINRLNRPSYIFIFVDGVQMDGGSKVKLDDNSYRSGAFDLQAMLSDTSLDESGKVTIKVKLHSGSIIKVEGPMSMPYSISAGVKITKVVESGSGSESGAESGAENSAA